MAEWDRWVITTDDRVKHDAQFQFLKPINGYITGEQAKVFFLKSGLSVMVLGQIWSLADMDMDGKMDKKEFSIAMFLIKKALEGTPLPLTLPLGLKNDPQPAFVTSGSTLALSLVTSSGQNGLSSVSSSNGHDSNFSSAAYQDWVISQNNRPRYRLLFNQHDRNKRGFLTGVEARSILLQYGLSNPVLAHIWNLADLDKDGNLNCDEFCIAIFLIEKALSGSQLPSTLPPGLLPSNQARPFSNSISPANVSSKEDDNESKENKSSSLSFEDKRRENFRQGQAELDRRKQELAEKMRQEEEIRLENERLEREKQQKLRLEKERQQAAEAEKQAELARQLEAQREQRRRQAVEQRMKAAREAEKQRQIESERLRTEALLKERNHVQTLLEQAVAHRASLLESASSQQQRLSELDSRLTLAQTEVDSHKTVINEMRGKRDAYERDIRDMTEQMEAAKAELTHWQREKEQLSLRMTAGVDMNPVMEQYKTLQSMREARIKTIEQLRNKLNELDQNMTQQGHELATRRNKIDDSQRRVTRVMLDLVDLRHSVEQKMQTYKSRKKNTDLSTSNSTTASSNQKELYEAMFDFTARHPDELSFTAGTLIDVFQNAPINVGPGWLYGQINDKVGLFPESYARKKVDGKIDPFDPFGVHKVTNISNPVTTTTTSTSGIANNSPFDPVNVTNTVSSSTEPVDGLVKDESSKTPGDESLREVQNNWDASLCTQVLPVDVQPDQLLTLKSGDQVKISKESENKEWLYAEVIEKSGITRQGWLPVSCLKPVTKMSSDVKNGLNVTPKLPADSSIPQSNNILFSCVALYPYESNVPGDLNLSVGDLIRVYVIKDDWWEGMCERTKLHGLFPANYVRKLSKEENRAMEEKLGIGRPVVEQSENNKTAISLPQSKSTPVASPKPEDQGSNDRTVTLLSSSNASSSPSSCGVVVCTQPEFARVIAPYKATSAGQLSLQPGQVVQLRKRSPKGWWEGELQQRGHIRQIGWFPADFVRLISPLTVNGTSDIPSPVLSKDQIVSKATNSTSNLTENSPNSLKVLASKAVTSNNNENDQSQPVQSSHVEMMQTIFSYKAVHADELTFDEGAIITVLGRDEPEWWRGRLQSSGAEGLFPVNYVRPYKPPSQTEKPSSQRLSSAIPNPTDTDISRKVRERDFAVKELIETELAYNQSLIEVRDVFYKPLKAAKLLNAQLLDDIFPHWDELIETSTELCQDLKNYIETGSPVEAIGQILLKHMVKFKVYRLYCIRQRVACETLQQCLSSNYRLNQLVKIFEKNTKTKGLPLSSYLLKPMQRVTKYKLIVEKIVANTDPSYPNYGDFSKAHDLICSLLRSIDHAIGSKDKHQIIDWFRSRLVGADKWLLDWLSSAGYVAIDHNNVNNDKPCLVHCGTLYKAKNNREFICFLFNKYLILTTPNYNTNGQLFELPSTNERNAKWSFTLYKEPLALNQIYVLKGSFRRSVASTSNSFSSIPPYSASYNKSSNDEMTSEMVRSASISTLTESSDNFTMNARHSSEIKSEIESIFSLLKRRNSWHPIVTLKAPSNQLCDLWVSILRETIRAENSSSNALVPVSRSIKNEYPKRLLFTILKVSTNNTQDKFEVHFKISITDQMWKFCQTYTNQSNESKPSESLSFLVPESSDKCLHISAFNALPFTASNVIGSCTMPFKSIFTNFPPSSSSSFCESVVNKQIVLDQSTFGLTVSFHIELIT